MDAFVSELWVAIKAASPLGAMLCFFGMVGMWRLYVQERVERLAVTKAKDELHERVLTGLNDTRAAVKETTAALGVIGETVRDMARSRQ